MNNSLKNIENNLRSIAKRYKFIKFTTGLAIAFLMLGVNAFSEETVMNDGMTRGQIMESIKAMYPSFNKLRAENDKKIAGARLELIQLMEQGDQVVKSPWASWQFGLNYMYDNWGNTYKGRGDKEEKYPYEGIFTRSKNIFGRTVSLREGDTTQHNALREILEPLGEWKLDDPKSAMNTNRKNKVEEYGLLI